MLKDKKVILNALEKYVDQKQIEKIRKVSNYFHPKDLYEFISLWPIEKIMFLIRTLKEERAAELFDEFTSKEQEKIIKAFSDEELAKIFESLYIDEAIDIIEELPAKIVTRILNSVDSETRKIINKLLKYDPSTVGAHMHVDIVSIRQNQTITEARKQIKRKIKTYNQEIAGVIYVHDNNKKFIGYITLESIFSEKGSSLISDHVNIINPVKTNDNMIHAQSIIYDYEINSVPVVDSKSRLVGAIEADDIIERLGNIDEAVVDSSAIVVKDKSYLEITAWEMFKSRVLWIIFLVIIGSLTQIIITGFQNIWSMTPYWGDTSEIFNLTMSTIVTLAFSTALSIASSINDAAGNTGSQSSAMLVRAMALGEIQKKDYGKAIKKETIVGFYLGITIAFTAFFRTFVVWAMFGYLNLVGNKEGYEILLWLTIIAIISSVSFGVSILVGNFLGAILPIVAKRFNWDGAVVSGPVQTTLVDILTFTIYLGLTSAIFLPLAYTNIFGTSITTLNSSITSVISHNNIDILSMTTFFSW